MSTDLDHATRARLEARLHEIRRFTGDETADAVRALLTAHAQAAPVLAAAEQMAGLRATYLAIMNGDITPASPAVEQYTRDAETIWEDMVAAVAAWRAAREG